MVKDFVYFLICLQLALTMTFAEENLFDDPEDDFQDDLEPKLDSEVPYWPRSITDNSNKNSKNNYQRILPEVSDRNTRASCESGCEQSCANRGSQEGLCLSVCTPCNHNRNNRLRNRRCCTMRQACVCKEVDEEFIWVSNFWV
jgi:hypothetical protein